MNIPTVSILIPVYNAEKYLQECLDHALGQTLQDIEVVCVNDYSTDNSLAILNEYAAKDARLKVIDLPENKGTLVARKIATMAAGGVYSLYCDPDDYISRETCEECSSLVRKHNCDMVYFSGDVFGASPQENHNLTTFCACPVSEKTTLKDLILSYYLQEKDFRTCLTGLLVKTDILQKAYSLFPDVHMTLSEDMLVLFSILCRCCNLYGLQKKYYHYRRVDGITKRAAKEIESSKKVLNDIEQHVDILNKVAPLLISDFCPAELVYQLRDTFLEKLYRYTLSARLLSLPFSPEVTGEMLHNFYHRANKRLFVKSIAPHFQKMKIDLEHLKILEKSGIITPTTFHFANIKTVAFINLFNALGGIERYITKLIPVYQKMGLRVILINETEASDNEYPLLADVKTYVVSDKPELRVDQLAEIFQKEQVDLVYVQSYDNLFPDLLVAKLLFGIPVINHWHTIFSRYIHSRQDFKWKFSYLRHFSDLTICLSPSCECFFRANGIKAKYLMNPPAFSGSREKFFDHSHNNSLKTILWLARLEANIKRPREAVAIMQEVVKTLPDAKMLIVGGVTPWSKNEDKILADMIQKAGLENNATLCGEQLDVESYYRKADVFLMTSTVEGLPNTIYEASAHGLPVVMYDLPYLAYHSYPENGIVSVPMNDKNAAAEAICRILQNEDEHRELSARSRKMAEDISAIDFEQEWREIFAALERGGEELLHIGEEHQGALRVMMETLREHTLLGVNTKFRNLNDEIARLKKNQASWLVRKFRGGIQCLKDNGFRYTVKRFFEKVKGKLSRRKGAT